MNEVGKALQAPGERAQLYEPALLCVSGLRVKRVFQDQELEGLVVL